MKKRKILYAIQATGNGHISRAMELLPYLEQYGEIDLFLSGANSSLSLDAPVKYRSKGLSLFYTCSGKLDYIRMFRKFAPIRLRREVKDLPVEKYDLVINDFECITSLSCALKKIPSINFGHQASFMSEHTPRPEKQNPVGEWLLKNYARSSKYLGLHFQPYDDFILTPVIKKEIWEALPGDQGFITVYLPSYCDVEIMKYFGPLVSYDFRVFSPQASSVIREGHITFIPVEKQAFNQCLINCGAIICGAGFETPAEILHLKKKMIVIPIKGQYEQQCNAAALERLGVKSLQGLTEHFPHQFESWIQNARPVDIQFRHSTAQIIETMMNKAGKRENLDFSEMAEINESFS